MNRIDGLSPLATSRTQHGREAAGVDGASGVRGDGAAAGQVSLDQVSLSGRSRVVARAAAIVDGAPDVRAAKVAALKAAIASGSYVPDPTEVATRLLASGVFGPG